MFKVFDELVLCTVFCSVVDPELEVMDSDSDPDPKLDLNLNKIH
jgi:hypothetical protein